MSMPLVSSTDSSMRRLNADLTLRHRLDAQSVVWAIVRASEDEPSVNGGQPSDEVEQVLG